MKANRVVMIIASTACLSVPADGLPAKTARTNSDQDARRQVLATDDRRMAALRRRDPAPLKLIYADDYSLVTPSGTIRSKKDQLRDLVSGRATYSKIDVKSRTVRVYGDVALVLSDENLEIAQGAQHIGGHAIFTRTYKKFGDGWRVIGTQGTFVSE